MTILDLQVGHIGMGRPKEAIRSVVIVIAIDDEVRSRMIRILQALR